jgi:hypothetical protein
MMLENVLRFQDWFLPHPSRESVPTLLTAQHQGERFDQTIADARRRTLDS